MKIIIVLVSLLTIIRNFTFIYPSVSVDILTINTPATYTIHAERNYDNSLQDTPYNTQLVPANSTIVVQFPSQYNLALSTPICSSLLINGNSVTGFTVTISANNLTISKAILNSQAIANVTITIQNVTNPYPAITTNPFIIVIGQDISSSSTSSAVTLTPSSFISCNITFNPTFVNTTGAMVVTLSPKNKILQYGYIDIIFPSNLQWSQDVSTNHPLPIGSPTCTILSGGIVQSVCSGSIAQAQVTLNLTSLNLSSLISPFSFQINNLFSPPTINPQDILTITSYSPDGYSIDTTTCTITGLTPQVLSITITPSVNPFYVNSVGTLAISFTLPDTIIKSDYFQLIFPAGSIFTFKAISLSNLTIQASAVTYTSSNLTLIMRQSLTSPIRYAGTFCSIAIGTYTAPPSAKTTQSFILQVYNTFNNLKMQGSTTLTATAKQYTMTVSASSYLINQNAIYTLQFTTTDNLTNTGFIIANFPSGVTLNISNNCVNTNFPAAANISCSINGTNSITFTNLTTNGLSPSTYNMAVSSIINPVKAVSNLAFSMSFYYMTGHQYLVAYANFTGIIILPKQINALNASIQLSNYYVSASQVSINLLFTPSDNLFSNGFIIVQIPPEMSIVSGYYPLCTLSVNGASNSANCQVVGQIFNISLGSVSISANSLANISLFNFGINPKSTRPTSSLQLYAYSPDYYMINYINTSLTISNFIPIPFFFESILPISYVNNANNIYSFYFQQSNSWDNNSYGILQLPPSIAFSSSNVTCINTLSNSNISCSVINSSYLNISLPIAGTSMNINLIQLKNPSSYRPSGSFSFTTYTSDGYVYATNQSITITTNTASNFSNISFSYSSQVYNTTTDLTISITNTDSSTSQYTLANSNQLINSAVANISCSSSTTNVSCTLAGSTLNILASASFPLSTTITIHNLFIPMSNVTAMAFSSYDANYLMSVYNSITFQTQCSLPCYTCLSASSPSVCKSCYSTTVFTTLIYFSAQNCYAYCPAGTFASNGSNICQTCSSNCAQCSFLGSNCTQCVSNSSNPVLYLYNSSCISTCPAGSYSNNNNSITKYTPICSTCVSPCSTCTSSSSCLSCLNSSLFYYNNQCLTGCPINITINNATSMQCQPCSLICLTCVNSSITCLTCNATIAPFYVSANQTCVSNCVSPLVPDNDTCVPCSSPCNSCVLNKNNCTSCLNGTNTFLSLLNVGSCVTSCQKQYFSNSTSLTCQLCSSVIGLNCNNCFNSSVCITCNPGFVFFNFNSSCLSQTPVGYVNMSGVAVSCTSNCTQCSQTTYNCSQCSGNYSLFYWGGIGYCDVVCPNTTLSINNSCIYCTYPCLSCNIILSNCSYCVTGYLLTINNMTQCVDNCPSGMFINSNSLSCQSCSPPCSSCVGSALFCTGCQNSSYYILNYSCISTCPNGTLSILSTMTCNECILPCTSCQLSINNCTTCTSGYYYYSATNRCYLSCPSNISVIDPLNPVLSCISCTNNCFTCYNQSSNCLSCNQNYSLFNNTCISSCPSGLYSNSSVCVSCINNCLTCTSPTICLSCQIGFVKFSNQCLIVCPVAHSILINNTCTACSNSCYNCSSNDICYECPSSAALYNSQCVTSCPSPLIIFYNTSSNTLSCFTQSQITSQQLQSTLQFTSILPLPFTIITTFLFLCSLMSKIQNIATYTTGVGYSLYGCAEVASLIYLFYIYNLGYATNDDFSLYFLLYMIAFGIIALLNLLSLTCVNFFLCSDVEFNNWLNYRRIGTPQSDTQQYSADAETNGSQKQNENVECCSHTGVFALFTIMSFIVSYKFKLLIFTKLFKLNCLTAHLRDIQHFKAFNILSFFGLLHQGLVCYICIKFYQKFNFSQDNKLYLATIDCFVVTLICFIFALLTTNKESDFFKIHNDNQVDLGRRKRDKNHLKNFKINGMNSRDKLIDINDSHTDAEQDQQIIVNHNITTPNHPKKVSNEWVETKKQQLERQRKLQQSDNIFQVNEQYEEDSYSPYIEPMNRVELFHTSTMPNKSPKNSKAVASPSRVNDWVEVDLDKEEKEKLPTKLQMSEVRQSQAANLSRLSIQSTSKLKSLNFMPSIIKIDLQGTTKKNQERSVINFISQRQVVIKETDSQYINQSHKKSQQYNSDNKNTSQVKIIFPQNKLKGQLKKNSLMEVMNFDDLNKTIENGVIVQSNKSYESVLPFVHQNGILKDKKLKQIKQSINHNNNLVAIQPKINENIRQKVTHDMAIQANMSATKDQVKSRREVEDNGLQDLLEISEIQQIKLVQKEKSQIQIQKNINKISEEVQVEKMQRIDPIKILKINKEPELSYNFNNLPPTNKVKHSLNFAPLSQINQKIGPSKQSKQSHPIIHAPRVYKSRKILNPDGQFDEFEQKLYEQEEQLLRVKEQRIKSNNLLLQRQMDLEFANQNKSKKNKSKKSIKAEIEQALKNKQTKKSEINENLIIQRHMIEQIIPNKNQSQQDIQEIQFANQKQDQKSIQRDQKTVKNYISSKESSSSNKIYEQSQISKNCKQLGNNITLKDKSKNETSLHRNIFDKKVYTESQQLEANNQYISNHVDTNSQDQPSNHHDNTVPVFDQSKGQSLPCQDQVAGREESFKELKESQKSQNRIDINEQSQVRLTNKDEQSEYQSQQKSIESQKDYNLHQVNQNQKQNQIYNLNQNIDKNQEEKKYYSSKQIDVLQSKQTSQQYSQNNSNKDQMLNKQQEQEVVQVDQLINQQKISQNLNAEPRFIGQQLNQVYKSQQEQLSLKNTEQNGSKKQRSAKKKSLYNPQKDYQDKTKLFQVEYEQRQLYNQQNEELFEVRNCEQDYQEQNEQEIDSNKAQSIQLKKTSKRYPTKQPIPSQQDDHNPIRFTGGYQIQAQQRGQEEQMIFGKIKKSRSNLANVNEPQSNSKQKPNNQQIADLLKNVNHKIRMKKLMPKEQRDQRILIKMDRQQFNQPQKKTEDTNLLRKSTEKSNPLKLFKVEHRNQQYSEDEDRKHEYRQSYNKNETQSNIKRPAIDRNNSLRQSNPKPKIIPEKAPQQKNIKGKYLANKEIQQFNFGDEMSSELSKDRFSSQAELVKWKNEFIERGQLINMEPSYSPNNIPLRPIISKLQQEDDDQLQVIQERGIGSNLRKRSRKSKQRSKRKDNKHSQLQKIYGL